MERRELRRAVLAGPKPGRRQQPHSRGRARVRRRPLPRQRRLGRCPQPSVVPRLALSQEVTQADSLHVGWAHANRTPGDPGQHNPPTTATVDPNLGFGFSQADNRANMYTAAWKHLLDKNATVYFNYATTQNHRFAHYDLGAGGRSVTTDCHDATNTDATRFAPHPGAPRCWTGAHLQAFSIGLNYKF